MKETAFIQRNVERWRETEKIIQPGSNIEPDRLHDLFIQLTDDLSFARTYFNGSQTNIYLNEMAAKTYHLIYKNKKIKNNRILEFWKYDYPLLTLKYRAFIITSLAIFILSFSIGWLSSIYDTGFTRLILSDKYVNMTSENIKSGDPFAVYKSMNQADGFFAIAFNNIYISFLAFVGGMLFTFGTVFLILRNGVMLGAFLLLFWQKGLLPEALSVIFIHGTLEIFSIIVAGASGFLLGTRIVITGTHGRLRSFMDGARDGVMLLLA